MNHSLSLYSRPNRGSSFVTNITGLALDWSRSIAAVGGYTLGSFSIGADKLNGAEMTDWYNNYAGCVIQESSDSMVSWEGLIYEMRLVLGGVEYVRSLAPERWHNRVKVIYSSDIGLRADTGWSENTDASAEYGRMAYMISLGGATAAAVAEMRLRHLAEFAWPRSWMVGPMEVPGNRGGNSLQVLCAGFWATLNWRYRETSLTAQASALVQSLVAASEWVTAGRIESNTASRRVDAFPNPKRLGEAIEEIIEQGDTAGNVWQGGVYAGRQLIYEPAPTTVQYYWRNGRITDAAGGEVIPTLMPAGVLIQNAEAPTGGQPAGTSSAWDDPRNGYVEGLDYSAERGLRLRLRGAEEGTAVLEARIGRGNA